MWKTYIVFFFQEFNHYENGHLKYLNGKIMDIQIYSYYIEYCLMSEKQCHKPPMTWNGLYHRFMVKLGMVYYCFTHIICFGGVYLL